MIYNDSNILSFPFLVSQASGFVPARMGLFGHQIFSNVPGMSEWAHNARGPGPQNPPEDPPDGIPRLKRSGKVYTDCIAIVMEGYVVCIYIYIYKYTYVYTHIVIIVLIGEKHIHDCIVFAFDLYEAILINDITSY